MTAAISFWAAEDFQILGGSGLSFYGDAFNKPVRVGEWPQRCFITDSNALYQGPECDNVSYVASGTGKLGQSGETLALRAIPNYQAPLNIRLTNNISVAVTGVLVSVAASDVTCMLAEVIHPGEVQSGDGSGSIAWHNGQLRLTDRLDGATRHDWYVLLSPSADTASPKHFALDVDLQYFRILSGVLASPLSSHMSTVSSGQDYHTIYGSGATSLSPQLSCAATGHYYPTIFGSATPSISPQLSTAIVGYETIIGTATPAFSPTLTLNGTGLHYPAIYGSSTALISPQLSLTAIGYETILGTALPSLSPSLSLQSSGTNYPTIYGSSAATMSPQLSLVAAGHEIANWNVTPQVSGTLTLDSACSSTNQPIHWWKFDDASGTTAADSGWGTHVSAVNIPHWSTSNLPVIAGNVSDVYTTRDDTDDIQFNLEAVSDPMTIMGWVNQTATFNANTLFGGSGSKTFSVSTSNGYLKVMAGGSGVTSSIPLYSNYNTHWAVRRQGTQYDLFVNGVAASGGTLLAPSGSLRYSTIVSPFETNLALDDYRVYDSALTDSAIYAIGSGSPIPVHWWKFDEASGGTAADSGWGTRVSATGVANWTSPGMFEIDNNPAAAYQHNYDDVTHFPLEVLSTNMTAMGWFNIVNNYDIWGSPSLFFGTANGSLRIETGTNGLKAGWGGQYVTASGAALIAGQDTHWAVRRTDSHLDLFLDAVLVASGTLPGSPSGSTEYTCGNSLSFLKTFTYDDYRVYDSALTDAQIRNIRYSPGAKASLAPTLGLTSSSYISYMASASINMATTLSLLGSGTKVPQTNRANASFAELLSLGSAGTNGPQTNRLNTTISPSLTNNASGNHTASVSGPTSGAFAWWKMDTITGLSNNASMSGTLTDNSGNGRNLSQSVGSKQPTYKTNQINGYAALYWPSGNAYLEGPGGYTLPAGSSTYVAVVNRIGGGSSLLTIVGGYDINCPLFGVWSDTTGGAGNVDHWCIAKANVDVGVDSTTTLGSGEGWAIISVVYNKVTANFYKGLTAYGTPAYTQTFTGNSNKGAFLGAGYFSPATSSLNWRGYIAEAIVYPFNLSSGELTTTVNYLKNKYNL